MRINGELVTLRRVGNRWEASIGSCGMVTICGATAAVTMRRVVEFLEGPSTAAA